MGMLTHARLSFNAPLLVKAGAFLCPVTSSARPRCRRALGQKPFLQFRSSWASHRPLILLLLVVIWNKEMSASERRKAARHVQPVDRARCRASPPSAGSEEKSAAFAPPLPGTGQAAAGRLPLL